MRTLHSKAIKFRLNYLLTVSDSRITPGGKAAAANVAVGDYLLAVNHQALQDASLLNVMELIKGQMQKKVKKNTKLGIFPGL